VIAEAAIVWATAAVPIKPVAKTIRSKTEVRMTVSMSCY
jgi:hypothetical protein